MKAFKKIEDIRAIRKKLGLSQKKFWNQIGVTQSGGSRYESGRKIPKPVCALVYLIHVKGFDLKKLEFVKPKK